MLFYGKLLAIVFAVSIDGFGVGLTYGMRQIRLSLPALLIITLSSATVVCLSMTIGFFIRSFVTPDIASIIGSCLLILLGIFVLITTIKDKYDLTILENNTIRKMTSLLTNPHQADKDQSGMITGKEAIFLGIALAMDAFGAGFAASILGYPVLFTSVFIGLMSAALLYAGTKIGFLLSQSVILKKFTFLPPLLLIGIGVFNLLQ